MPGLRVLGARSVCRRAAMATTPIYQLSSGENSFLPPPTDQPTVTTKKPSSESSPRAPFPLLASPASKKKSSGCVGERKKWGRRGKERRREEVLFWRRRLTWATVKNCHLSYYIVPTPTFRCLCGLRGCAGEKRGEREKYFGLTHIYLSAPPFFGGRPTSLQGE